MEEFENQIAMLRRGIWKRNARPNEEKTTKTKKEKIKHHNCRVCQDKTSKHLVVDMA